MRVCECVCVWILIDRFIKFGTQDTKGKKTAAISRLAISHLPTTTRFLFSLFVFYRPSIKMIAFLNYWRQSFIFHIDIQRLIPRITWHGTERIYAWLLWFVIYEVIFSIYSVFVFCGFRFCLCFVYSRVVILLVAEIHNLLSPHPHSFRKGQGRTTQLNLCILCFGNWDWPDLCTQQLNEICKVASETRDRPTLFPSWMNNETRIRNSDGHEYESGRKRPIKTKD
jgi:hypothetical protein